MVTELDRKLSSKDAKYLPLSERERRLKEVPVWQALTNCNIWLGVVGSVSQSRKEKFLRESERSRIIEAYQNAYPNTVPVSELLVKAEVADLRRDKFLARVAFNYDYAMGARERHTNALQQLQEGKWTDPLGVVYDYQFWNPQVMAERELELLGKDFLSCSSAYNQNTRDSERVYSLTGINPDRIDRAVDAAAAFILPLTLLVMAGGGAMKETRGWEMRREIKDFYEGDVSKFLYENEIVKAGDLPLRAYGSSWFPNRDNPKIIVL